MQGAGGRGRVQGGWRFFLALLALVALAGCAQAPPGRTASAAMQAGEQVEAPRWRVGSEWRYSDGYGLKVVRTDGAVTTFQRLDDARQWISRRGFIRESSRSSTAERRLLFEALPPGGGLSLTAGEPLTYRREYLVDGATRTHAVSWTVEGREVVTVPAGQFDCVVLVMRARSLSGDWTGYERWWFSPQAQGYVRMEYRYGPDAEGSRVLMTYALPTEAGQPGDPASARTAER